MVQRNIAEVKENLSALLALVEEGEEVIIARAGKPVARIVKIDRKSEPRTLGALRGQFWVSPDFDEPDPELEKLIYEGPIEPAA